MPPQRSIRGPNGRELGEYFSLKSFDLGRKPRSLIVVELQGPRSDLFREDSILLAQIVEDLPLLMIIQPTTDTSSNRNGSNSSACGQLSIPSAELFTTLGSPAFSGRSSFRTLWESPVSLSERRRVAEFLQDVFSVSSRRSELGDLLNQISRRVREQLTGIPARATLCNATQIKMRGSASF